MSLHAVSDSFNVSGDDGEPEPPAFRRDPSRPPLSESQLAEILKAQEGPRLEFKRVSGKMVSRAIETICAFANASGGTLILGVADPRLGRGKDRIHGIEENPEAVDELRRKLET